PVVKGGKICVLLGKKVDKKNGKESAGIMSWIDVGALNIVKSSKPPDNQKLYRVQVGAFSNRGNADALLKKLKSAGFTDAFIK
ncbi:SPOR domain-containing protein, partial [Shouchella clausii]